MNESRLSAETKLFISQFEFAEGGLCGAWTCLPTKDCRCVECGEITKAGGKGTFFVHAIMGYEMVGTNHKTEAELAEAICNAETACFGCFTDQQDTFLNERSIPAAHWLGLCDFDGKPYSIA